MLPPDRKGAFFRALRAGERPGDPGEAKAEGATRTLVFVLFRAGFFQLLGGTAGRAPEPVEEIAVRLHELELDIQNSLDALFGEK